VKKVACELTLRALKT